MNKQTFTNSKHTYNTPTIEVIDVITEQGFAQSTNYDWNSNPTSEGDNELNIYS